MYNTRPPAGARLVAHLLRRVHSPHTAFQEPHTCPCSEPQYKLFLRTFAVHDRAIITPPYPRRPWLHRNPVAEVPTLCMSFLFLLSDARDSRSLPAAYMRPTGRLSACLDNQLYDQSTPRLARRYQA